MYTHNIPACKDCRVIIILLLFSLWWWWWCWSAFVCSVALLAKATKRRYPNNIVFSIIMWYFRMHLMKPRVWLIRHMRNHSLNAFFRTVFSMRHILPLFRVCKDSLFFWLSNIFTCDFFSLPNKSCVNEFS